MEITLKYTSSRKEVAHSYWHMWRRKLWIYHMCYFILAAFFSLAFLSPINVYSVICSLIIGAVVVSLFIVYPQVMFKPQMRTLTVNESGIQTNIGRKSGSIRWDEISSIETSPDLIKIIRERTLNAFLVPRRAFQSEKERNDFLSAIKEWKEKAVFDPQSIKADKGIAGAYKRKEYGWFYFYIAAVVLGAKIAGIGGIVGATIMAAGLYSTARNKLYSKAKKVWFSVAYVVGSVALSILIVMVFVSSLRATGVIPTYTPAAQQVLNAAKTSSIAFGAATSTASLEQIPFSTSTTDFEIRGPKGWTLNSTGKNVVVEFDDPTPGHLAVETIGVDQGMGAYTLQQYAAGAMQGLSSADQQNPPKNIDIIAQGNITLDGQPAYMVEFTYTYMPLSGQAYLLHSQQITLIHDDVGYEISVTSQKEMWNEYKDLFAQSISSFGFLK